MNHEITKVRKHEYFDPRISRTSGGELPMGSDRSVASVNRREFLAVAAALWAGRLHAAEGPDESAEGAQARHERVARRRSGVSIICHRGASEFAHENTLEAYRASFDLGADGNEIDIRSTRDGVLVCFHDDMLDHLIEAFGDVGDYDWSDLARVPFRRPGWLGDQCRIPTLEEVFELHRQQSGLMHLDVKRPGLEPAIARLLDRLDLWDHIMAVNSENAPALLKDSRCHALRYRGSLYADRKEVFPDAIAEVLKAPGEAVIVDDPRGAIVAFGRTIGRPNREPVAARPVPPRPAFESRSEQELLQVLSDDAGWDQIPQNPAGLAEKAQAIRRRAEAAEEIRRRKLRSPRLFAALAGRVRRRSLHPEWMYHGLDGGAALRALLDLKAPGAVALAREALWRDDPAVEPVIDPKWNVPRSWGDFRTKAIVFDLVARIPGEPVAQLCRDYLALLDEEARRIGGLQYEPAGRALLAIAPQETTALELLVHRRPDVRGRAILDCLNRIAEPWARKALESAAPHALAYVVPEK
jgi:glycerophosphoryl diester phosphodiesterase